LTRGCFAICVLGMVLAASGTSARAADKWSVPFPGVRHLERTDEGHLYHVVTVRLDSPYFSIRATKPGEKGQTTSSFAERIGAALAVNGDGFAADTYTPRGPAVGDGVQWPGTKKPAEHKEVGFIACADNQCVIQPGGMEPKEVAEHQDRWNTVVGGSGAPLIRNGTVRTPDEDSSCGAPCTGDQPRTAVALDKYRVTLFLLVAEGGRPGVTGPTLRQVALVLHGLGAHSAISLEGGKSSTMVIAGKRVNELPARQRREERVANHFAVVYTPPQDGCSLAKRIACAGYGCSCVAEECNGGFCGGDGCTEVKRAACANYGCHCVDMQCSGGFCPGNGCTAKIAKECKKRGCFCVDRKCAGGECPGVACTAKQVKDCAKFGCACAEGKCSGGYCAGTGCEAKATSDCIKFGCACVDGKCSGGHCSGNGCTAKMTKDCWAKGCGCVDGKCAGGKCRGSGCTIKQVNDCSERRCGCVRGKCTGGRCVTTGCGSCACDMGRAPTTPGATLWLVGLLLLVQLRRRRSQHL
jgi:MYXO-CTERM domain-containing protein